jgi:hypothetical protein
MRQAKPAMLTEVDMRASMSKSWSATARRLSASLFPEEHVYITTDLTAAQLYAASNSAGGRKIAVYEVIPQGILEPDPDCRHSNHSYACEKAKIVAVHNVPGKLIKKARRVLLTRGQ